MIKAAILDFDGLILDTETPFQRSWGEIYAEHGLTVTGADWAELIGSSSDPEEAYERLERHLGRPVDREALRRRRSTRELELLRRERVLPGVRELIDDADDVGIRLGIASSSDRRWVIGHLTAIGLRDRFAVVVCAEEVAATKPAPDLYAVTLDRLGMTPAEAIAFEDSVRGVAAAKAAGLYCVAVPNPVTCHLAFPEADRVVSSLAGHRLSEFVKAATAAPDRG